MEKIKRRGHTPYGYQIENGIAVICEKEAGQIREIYKAYLSGLTLIKSAEAAGLKMNHASVKMLLRNKHYLGDEFYPAIIDHETFSSFEEELKTREKRLGRDKKAKLSEADIKRMPPTKFRMAKQNLTFCDPYAWAEYVYGLIETVR